MSYASEVFRELPNILQKLSYFEGLMSKMLPGALAMRHAQS